MFVATRSAYIQTKSNQKIESKRRPPRVALSRSGAVGPAHATTPKQPDRSDPKAAETRHFICIKPEAEATAASTKMEEERTNYYQRGAKDLTMAGKVQEGWDKQLRRAARKKRGESGRAAGLAPPPPRAAGGRKQGEPY